MKIIIRTLIALTALCLVLAVLPMTRGGWSGLFAISSGTSPYCSFWSKWKAGQAAVEQKTRTQFLEDHSSVLKTRDGLKLVETIYGQWWVPENSNYISYQFSELDRGIYGNVNKGDVVLDCGANIGQYSKHALNQGAAKVIAIEPAPENLECLRMNLSSEIAEGRVVVYPKGVWDKEDLLPMSISDENSATDSFIGNSGPQDHQILLPLTTIDKLVNELELSRVDLIKMDIEGAERNALQGAFQTLKRFQPRLAVCVYHLPDDPEVAIGLVEKIVPGYEVDCDCMPSLEGLYPQVAHFTAP